MPSCYPYSEAANYRVTWTGNATPSSIPASACSWQAGRGECRSNPQSELELRFAWPAEGSFALTAVALGDSHQTFSPALAATELAVAVSGAASTAAGGTSSGGSTGSAGSGGRGAPTGPAAGGSGASSACCDIVPNPAMRGRLGRVVVEYPEEVAARIDVYRAGETQALASGYGNAAFDLFAGTYEVAISGKRVTGVTVRSGNDTRIRVGVLRVTASDSTRVDVVNRADGRVFTSDYGTGAFGLPIGEVGVRVAGQTEAVVIEAGKVAEF
jgi:hypothetical protein